MSKKPESSNKVFQYFMVGSMGLLTAAGAKATVQGASCSTIHRKSNADTESERVG